MKKLSSNFINQNFKQFINKILNEMYIKMVQYDNLNELK